MWKTRQEAKVTQAEIAAALDVSLDQLAAAEARIDSLGLVNDEGHQVSGRRLLEAVVTVLGDEYDALLADEGCCYHA